MTTTATRETFAPGESVVFTYSLAPDKTSDISARLAHRTGQTVTVLSFDINDGEGLTFAERMEAATPGTYSVLFPDGHVDTVFEDELADHGMTATTTAPVCKRDDHGPMAGPTPRGFVATHPDGVQVPAEWFHCTFPGCYNAVVQPAAPAITCPTATTMPDGTPHTIVGCGSTNVQEDDSEQGLYDCGDCGIFFAPALEG